MISVEPKDGLGGLERSKRPKLLGGKGPPPPDNVETMPWRELHGNGSIVVRFSRKVQPKFEHDGGAWKFEIPELDVVERDASLEVAQRRAADRLAEETHRLTRTLVAKLSSEERKRRTKLLAYVDLLGGAIGIDFPKSRWLLGRMMGAFFVPVQEDIAQVAVPPALQRDADPARLWFARVATFRDGRPRGEVLEVEPAPGRSPNGEVP